MMPIEFNDVQRAAAEIRAKLGTLSPRVGLVLGSGLGGFAAKITDAVRISFKKIPHFPESKVAGHAGELVAGTVADVPVALLAGRVHLYEGWPVVCVVRPIRTLCALGVEAIVVTNAAGGIDREFGVGDLMLIDDHLNLTGQNALVGDNDERFGPRFVDMTGAYDATLRSRMVDAARATGVDLKRGVYAGLLGPTYETPAEVRMLAALGASAVGMSTVNEVIAARHRGVPCVGVSLITNLAAGWSEAPLNHDEVQTAAKQAAERFERLVVEFVRRCA